MAKLYGEIAKSALLTLDKSFSRALGQPLDASEVYYSLEAAKIYAATPAAYIGQKIVVIEDNKVTHYSIDDAAGTLKEVGVRPTGDGKSITVSAEGVVSILGAANADSLTLPRMKEDKSGIEWVPVSQVVQGDGNDNTTYEFTELTKGEGDAAETYGFTIKTLFNGTEVEGGNIEIAFDVYTKSEADTKFLAKADYTPYDDTALAKRVTDVENNKADKATTLAGYGIGDAYTKTEVNTAINEAVSGILGDDVKEAYDTLKEIQEILEGTDGEAIDGLIETAADNKAKIEVLNGGVDTAGSVDKKIADAIAPLATTEALNGVRDIANAAQTAEQVGTAIATALEDYYTADEIDAKGYAVANEVANTYATKAELTEHAEAAENAYAKKATTLAGYGITDAYTSTQTDAAIAAKIKEMTGGESAADVLLALNNYKASNDREVWGDAFVANHTVEGVYTPDYTGESRVDTLANRALALEEKVGHDVDGETAATGLFLEVDQARAQADKGVEDAAKAAQAVTQLAEGQVATNKGNIENLQALVGAVGDGKTDTLAGMIGALQAHDQAHAVEFNTLSGKVEQNIKDIATKANAADVYTKGETDALLVPYALAANVYTKEAANALLDAKADKATTYTKDEVNAELAKKLESADLADYAKTADIASTYATITALENIYKVTVTGEGEEAVVTASGVLADEITRAKAAEKVNADAITALDATLKAAIENDGEGLDSIKELALWIEDHEQDILPILSGFGGTDEPANIKTYVDESIAAIPAYELPTATATVLGGVKLSDEIGLDADSKLKINKVSTDVLENGVEELILNGGNSGITLA